ncbi:DUF6779 domain-containing protein [Corynebacterium alimapuense]|uniref:DUF6779 domain-containing protein n=1 Tax=Corynebacterium alimapuense TaxID=1576874 RepID=A0A3M8K9J1_9CORY|nr:DUF6779 domain-containing protein [Corynebacterium alimapuense]RNE49881.1 hypothetical protein C5L39_00455 [Corynebacterium alimapuense]
MSADNPSGQTDRGQILLIVLVALALIASVVMLFSGSDGALKLALLAALWAAIVGSFLVFRYRTTAEAAEAELEHQEELHRAELEKAQLQQHVEESDAELKVRETQEENDSEVLAEIQRELTLLRTQLEQLAGREFGYEPAALRAEARRVVELEQAGKLGSDWFDDEDDDGEAVIPEPVLGSENKFSGAPSPDAIAGRLGQQEPSKPQLNPLADLIAENLRRTEKEKEVSLDKEPALTDFVTPAQSDEKITPKAPAAEKKSDKESKLRSFDTGSFQTVSWDQGGAGKSRAAQVKAEQEQSEKPEQPAKKDTSTKESVAEETRRGRRRRDEHNGALSVAELMARARAGEDK